MTFHLSLFKKKHISSKVEAKGPLAEEQIAAIAEDRYWKVFNTDVLKPYCSQDPMLRDRANALKHSLQTYGPMSDQLPDLRHNKGTQGNIFHGHVIDSIGTTYVLEWGIVDNSKRIMALLRFASHENFPFKKEALNPKECKKIMSDPKNKLLSDKIDLKIQEVKDKVARTENNYRHCVRT